MSDAKQTRSLRRIQWVRKWCSVVNWLAGIRATMCLFSVQHQRGRGWRVVRRCSSVLWPLDLGHPRFSTHCGHWSLHLTAGRWIIHSQLSCVCSLLQQLIYLTAHLLPIPIPLPTPHRVLSSYVLHHTINSRSRSCLFVHWGINTTLLCLDCCLFLGQV